MDVTSIGQADPRLAGLGGRLRPTLELLIVVGVLEAELWFLRAKAPGWLNLVSFGLIVATLWFSADRRTKAGLVIASPPVKIWRAWVEVGLAASVLSAVLVFAAWIIGDASETFEFVFLHKPPLKLLNWLAGKFGAALLQQLALQLFLWPVCFEVTRNRAVGVLLAASIFGLVHLPSPTLVLITTLAGLVWIVLYQRTGRLAPLILSHMILATLAHGGLPERLTYDMRVGLAATADMKRFVNLNDPKIRLTSRRLKENRASLKHYSSDEYYAAQGNTPESFIRGLFRDIMGRTLSEFDVAFWMTRELANPRVDIPSILLASDEYAQIQERREASAGVRR